MTHLEYLRKMNSEQYSSIEWTICYIFMLTILLFLIVLFW